MKNLITVEYWPNTDKWRILVAGVPVGYWPTKEEAETRARQARREMRLSEKARSVIATLRLRGESEQACADRLISNLACIAENYEEHFGPQARQ